jgi:hypothetical protein
MEQIRIFFFAACPSNLPRVQVEAEFRHIEEQLDRSPLASRFDCRFLPAVRRHDLLRHLFKGPHVVHFSGHGTERDELMLENESGEAEPVSAEDLEEVFGLVPPESRPRVVVFSACYSEPQAEAVTRVVDCAVGMAQVIRDSSAFAFAKGFYLALGQGMPVDQAVESSRVNMPSTEENRALPQLHVRTGVSPGDVRFGGAGPVTRFPPDLQFDRKDQLECFREMLAVGNPKVLLVSADANMGKSRLIQTMAREARDHPLGFIDFTRNADT